MDIFSLLKRAKVLVIGDFMLDVYTMGRVTRISPEAPVPVLCVEQESRRPGGTGNAILNLISLGMEVVAVGRVGRDGPGHFFLETISEDGVDTKGIIVDPAFITPTKCRMIADNQQLLRVDHEMVSPLSDKLEKKLLKNLPELLKEVAVIAISDYAKGFLSRSLLGSLIAIAKEHKIPVIVDPKGIDFTKYKGATILKPNLSEAIAASGLEHDAPLDSVAEKLLREVKVGHLIVTRSKEGISIFSSRQQRKDFPARVREVKDVTGAGDTVLAIFTAALANKLDLGLAANLANTAAGIAVERLGCARISLEDLALRLVEEGHSQFSLK